MARRTHGRSGTLVNISTYSDDPAYPIGSNEWNENPKTDGVLGFTKGTEAIASNALQIEHSLTEVTNAGDINLDFADVQSIMRDAGPAWMSIGYGSGEGRAREAAQQAITNPLMDVSIEGATGVLFNISGGSDLKLSELHEAAEVIQRVVDPDANIIFGMTTDPKMESEIKLTIISTGFPTTETLIQRDIEKTVAAAQRVAGNEDSLDLPPFLRRNLGGFSVGGAMPSQNGHSD